MRVILKDSTQLRALIKTLREHNVAEEDDGYYYLEVTPDDFQTLLKTEDLKEVVRYMREGSRKVYEQGVAIMGWYGARITPTWLSESVLKRG